MERDGVLNDVMKALTTRKPISLTTTSMCSGPFAARIARSQRLHTLRIAVVATAGWERVSECLDAGLFRALGLEVQATIAPGGAAAVTALCEGTADVAFTDTPTAIRACAHTPALQFVGLSSDMDDAYIALVPAIDAHFYAMSRFARSLRKHAFADYVDVRALQGLIDRFAPEHAIGSAFPAQERISRVAEMSGTR